MKKIIFLFLLVTSLSSYSMIIRKIEVGGENAQTLRSLLEFKSSPQNIYPISNGHKIIKEGDDLILGSNTGMEYLRCGTKSCLINSYRVDIKNGEVSFGDVVAKALFKLATDKDIYKYESGEDISYTYGNITFNCFEVAHRLSPTDSPYCDGNGYIEIKNVKKIKKISI